MTTWNEVLQEIHARKTPDGRPDLDGVRREKMSRVSDWTKRPLIVYAVDFLNQGKAQAAGSGINLDWSDKEGFMEVIQDISGNKVDVLIHSPGGMAEAAHSIVEILRGSFSDVRFIVPNIAKSAATMLVLSGDYILMDNFSELGPIDPQFGLRKGDGSFITAPAQAIIDQFELAEQRVSQNPKLLVPWLPILQQYGPSLYQQAKNAIDLSKTLVEEWLKKYMLCYYPDRDIKAKAVAEYLADHNNFKSHAKRVGLNDIRTIEALKVISVLDMAEDQELLKRVRGLYHAISLTFDNSRAFKIFENTSGRALIRLVEVKVVQAAAQQQPENKFNPFLGEFH